MCVCVYRKQVLLSKSEADKDGVRVPMTLEEYCITAKPKPSSNIDANDIMTDFYQDDYIDDDDDDDSMGDGDDSGQGDDFLWSFGLRLLTTFSTFDPGVTGLLLTFV